MTSSPSNLKPRGLEPPVRRVLAVDAGSRSIRLLLLESRFGKLRVLRQEAIDLQEEGLVAADELKAHLQLTLTDWGRPPLALALPQQIAVSQIVDLPPVPDAEARQLIEAEVVKVAGASETAMVFDFKRVAPLSADRQSFWVTFCQEAEIQSRIEQLGLDNQEFRDVTTGANALIAAWQATHPTAKNAMIVHAGAQSTTVVVIHNGEGVFASSFPMGGDFFTRSIARIKQSSVEAAEALKSSTDLLNGDKKLPGFAEAVDGWAAELRRQLSEWRSHRPTAAIDLTHAEFIVTGGALEQPGLIDYLATKTGLKFKRWPTDGAPDTLQPAIGFEIALGTALQALGHGAQSASLLPANRLAAWKNRLSRQRLEFANSALVILCFIVLALGIWQKFLLIQRKQALVNKVQAGLETFQGNNALTSDLLNGYESSRPLFERQQTTIDTLESFSLLQQARSNRSLWFVLVADQQSYFSHPVAVVTNKSSPTNLVDFDFTRLGDATNGSPAKPGLIAAMSLPEDPDNARNTVSVVVNNLKKAQVFGRVDLVSEDLRRNLADSKVVLPDKLFTLALDFAITDFQAPRKGARPTSRFAPRPSRPEDTAP